MPGRISLLIVESSLHSKQIPSERTEKGFTSTHATIVKFIQAVYIPSSIQSVYHIHALDFSHVEYLIQIRHRQPIHNLHLTAQLVQGRLGMLRTQLARLGIGHEYKVISKQRVALGHLVFLCNLRSSLANIDGKGILDAEDGVGCFIGVAAQV